MFDQMQEKRFVRRFALTAPGDPAALLGMFARTRPQAEAKFDAYTSGSRKPIVEEESFVRENRMRGNRWISLYTPKQCQNGFNQHPEWLTIKLERARSRKLQQEMLKAMPANPFGTWLQAKQERDAGLADQLGLSDSQNTRRIPSLRGKSVVSFAQPTFKKILAQMRSPTVTQRRSTTQRQSLAQKLTQRTLTQRNLKGYSEEDPSEAYRVSPEPEDFPSPHQVPPCFDKGKMAMALEPEPPYEEVKISEEAERLTFGKTVAAVRAATAFGQRIMQKSKEAKKPFDNVLQEETNNAKANFRRAQTGSSTFDDLDF